MKGFSRIRRPYEPKDSQKKEESREEFEARQLVKLADKIEKGQYPYYSTIAYREYVYYRDPLQLALLAAEGDTLPEALGQLLAGINYFGKRGGFMQIMEQPRLLDNLPSGRFVNLTPDKQFSFRTDGTLQMLDDCGSSLTFQRANIYSADRITLGKERILRHVVLPYRLLRSSRSYSWYQRILEES
jgi:hypothetical protein